MFSFPSSSLKEYFNLLTYRYHVYEAACSWWREPHDHFGICHQFEIVCVPCSFLLARLIVIALIGTSWLADHVPTTSDNADSLSSFISSILPFVWKACSRISSFIFRVPVDGIRNWGNLGIFVDSQFHVIIECAVVLPHVCRSTVLCLHWRCCGTSAYF